MNEWKEGSYYRVLKNDKLTEQDKDAAYRTVQDYESWTSSELVNAFSTWNKIVYHSWYKVERTFAAIGLLGSATSSCVYKRSHLIENISNTWLKDSKL